MKRNQAEKLVKHVIDKFNVDGSVYIQHDVQNHRYKGEDKARENFSCSVFITEHSIERMEANNFYNLCKLVDAKLSAMGLEK